MNTFLICLSSNYSFTQAAVDRNKLAGTHGPVCLSELVQIACYEPRHPTFSGQVSATALAVATHTQTHTLTHIHTLTHKVLSTVMHYYHAHRKSCLRLYRTLTAVDHVELAVLAGLELKFAAPCARWGDRRGGCCNLQRASCGPTGCSCGKGGGS